MCPLREYLRGGQAVAKIKIEDIEHSEDLSKDKMKGIFGGAKGFVADQGGVGGLLKKGAGMAGEMIGGDAGGALQAAAGGDWMGAISGGAKALMGGGEGGGEGG
jgi:hypothetical protein